MTAYYNEIDPYAAQWLRNLIAAGLIAPGDVDERSIVDVQPDDLAGYTQCHFFAGIGGWSYAARLAGWEDSRPLWTGSCPCQPFSSAARGANKGKDDSRHLWPVWFRIIAEARPPVVFGEQVDEAASWLDDLCADMASLDYTTWARVLPAFVAEADHARERIYFASYPDIDSQSRRAEHAEASWLQGHNRFTGGMGPTYGVSARVAQLRAFGNAIVPSVAAEVIGAFLDERIRLDGVFA